MAKYTVELGEMLSAYASNLVVTENEESFDIYDPATGKTMTYSNHDFSYLKLNSPNWIIENYGADFIRSHVTHIPDNLTDQDDMNKAIIDKFLQTFIRHFYTYEIGQENPMSWWVTLEGFFAEHLPIWILGYQKLMIENLQFVTYESTTTGNVNANANQTTDSKSNNVTARADVPQNDLEWQFDTADPAKTYCFDYATVVTGSKDENNTESKQNQDQNSKSNTNARNYTIAQLINQMQGWSNGVYIELFQRAKAYGLFLMLVA